MKFIKDLKNAKGLRKIYGENAKDQLDRYEQIQDKFEELFGEGDVMFFSTSGRSEIIGNHTDHNHGCVLAAGISLDAVAAVRKTDNNVVRLISEGYAVENIIDLSDLSLTASDEGSTKGLIKGVAIRMKEHYGAVLGGFDAYVQSNVFKGSGLSSSAAIEVLIFNIFNYIYNENSISAVEGAKISQWAENNYFGKPCGLMDQTACAVGGVVYIDFYKPEEPVIEELNFDFDKEGYSVIITDVHADHADLTNEYAAITLEMKSVAKYFGKEYLADVSEDDFYNDLGGLRKQVSDRAVLRSIHFFEENKRVKKAAEAIRNESLDAFFEAINESGASSWKLLQNTHATGSDQQAMTLALALSSKILGSDGACRVHGGGFGGTILAFVPKKMKEEYVTVMENAFGENACCELSIRPVGTTYVDFEG